MRSISKISGSSTARSDRFRRFWPEPNWTLPPQADRFWMLSNTSALSRPASRSPVPGQPRSLPPTGSRRSEPMKVPSISPATGSVYSTVSVARSAVRDIFRSIRYADPRKGLLIGAAWETARSMICRTVGVSASAEEELARLAQRLNLAYRETAARVPANAAVEIVGVGEKVNLSVEALDKVEEPASLTALRAALDVRLPRLDLPELILEMPARIDFAAHFTHASKNASRAEDIATTVRAVLLAEATNTGSEPLVRGDVSMLRRSRLSWVKQNFIRAETLTAANVALVAAQNAVPLSCSWGGGEVAFADGLRFLVPVRNIHSRPSPR